MMLLGRKKEVIRAFSNAGAVPPVAWGEEPQWAGAALTSQGSAHTSQ